MLNYLTSAGRFLLERPQFNCIVVLTLYYVIITIELTKKGTGIWQSYKLELMTI